MTHRQYILPPFVRDISEEISSGSDEESDHEFENVRMSRMTLGYGRPSADSEEPTTDSEVSSVSSVSSEEPTAESEVSSVSSEEPEVEIVGEVLRPTRGRRRRTVTVATGSGTSEDPVTITRMGCIDIQGPHTNPYMTRSQKRRQESLPEAEPSKNPRFGDSVCPPVADVTVEMSKKPRTCFEVATFFKNKFEEKEKELQETKKELEEAKKERRLESARLSTEETITCAICMGILHRPMNLSPCAHRFCSSCLSTLLKQKLTPTHSQHSCPQCRTEIFQLSKDAFANQVVENYYATYPDQKPDPKELAKKDRYDKILEICRQSNRNIVLPPQRIGRDKFPLRAFE